MLKALSLKKFNCLKFWCMLLSIPVM